MKASTLARWEHKLSGLITKLPPKTVVSKYSSGRLDFLEKFKHEECKPYAPPKELERTLWGITFRSPIMNAAGMFKNGECYKLMHDEGAAGFQGGTTTWGGRRGNEKEDIFLPFAPYRRSHASSNWLGLPNIGDEEVAKVYRGFERKPGFSLVHSIMENPDIMDKKEKLDRLIDAAKLYERVGVDVLFKNKSCPNTGEGKPNYDLVFEDLRYFSEHFLKGRERKFPTAVKWSTDTKVEDVPRILDTMFELGYDGVEFGNTSTDYKGLRDSIVERERKLYDYFTSTFGGGVSGAPLKPRSLLLCTAAVQYLRAGPPKQEFHVWRTGGVQWADDIKDSDKIGVSMNTWFLGYWDKFAEHDHDIYKNIYKDYLTSQVS